MKEKYLKSIDRLVYDKWYKSGLKANVDWVAGGNFEGSISRLYLRFVSNSDIVELKSERLCDRREKMNFGKIIQGKFVDGGKGAINISFENRSMRGFVLGKNDDYIAFDCYFPNIKFRITEAYEIMR